MGSTHCRGAPYWWQSWHCIAIFGSMSYEACTAEPSSLFRSRQILPSMSSNLTYNG